MGVLQRLIVGALTREEAARWASEFAEGGDSDDFLQDLFETVAIIDSREVIDGRPADYLFDLSEVGVFLAELERSEP